MSILMSTIKIQACVLGYFLFASNKPTVKKFKHRWGVLACITNQWEQDGYLSNKNQKPRKLHNSLFSFFMFPFIYVAPYLLNN